MAFSGYTSLQVLYPKVVVDPKGVTWRLPFGRSGSLLWEEIREVETTARHTEMAGGSTLFSAHIVTVEGRRVPVAKGSLLQPWNKGELDRLTLFVQRHSDEGSH